MNALPFLFNNNIEWQVCKMHFLLTIIEIGLFELQILFPSKYNKTQLSLIWGEIIFKPHFIPTTFQYKTSKIYNPAYLHW